MLIQLLLHPDHFHHNQSMSSPDVLDTPCPQLSTMSDELFILFAWECETRRRFGSEAAAKLAQHRAKINGIGEDEMRKFLWKGLQAAAAAKDESELLMVGL